MATENKMIKISKTEKKKNTDKTKAKTTKNPLSFIDFKKFIKKDENKIKKPKPKDNNKKDKKITVPKKKRKIGIILNVVLSVIMLLSIGAFLKVTMYLLYNGPVSLFI